MNQQIEQLFTPPKKKSKKIFFLVALLGLFILIGFFYKGVRPVYEQTKTNDLQLKEIVSLINLNFPNTNPDIRFVHTYSGKGEKIISLVVAYQTSQEYTLDTIRNHDSNLYKELKEIVILIGRQNIQNYDNLQIRTTKKNPTVNDYNNPFSILLEYDRVLEVINNPEKPIFDKK